LYIYQNSCIKNILLLLLTSLITAALLSYTLKTNTKVPPPRGNQDKSITPKKVTEFENNMKAAGKKLTVNRYDAAHGFANPGNPGFNKAAREDAHKKTIAFLKERI